MLFNIINLDCRIGPPSWAINSEQSRIGTAKIKAVNHTKVTRRQTQVSPHSFTLYPYKTTRTHARMTYPYYCIFFRITFFAVPIMTRFYCLHGKVVVCEIRNNFFRVFSKYSNLFHFCQRKSWEGVLERKLIWLEHIMATGPIHSLPFLFPEIKFTIF